MALHLIRGDINLNMNKMPRPCSPNRETRQHNSLTVALAREFHFRVSVTGIINRSVGTSAAISVSN